MSRAGPVQARAQRHLPGGPAAAESDRGPGCQWHWHAGVTQIEQQDDSEPLKFSLPFTQQRHCLARTYILAGKHTQRSESSSYL